MNLLSSPASLLSVLFSRESANRPTLNGPIHSLQPTYFRTAGPLQKVDTENLPLSAPCFLPLPQVLLLFPANKHLSTYPPILFLAGIGPNHKRKMSRQKC